MKALHQYRYIPMLFGSIAGLSLSSCGTVTPADRISAHPAMFSALPPSQKALVQQGKIEEGMGRDAVFLAWGKPASPPAHIYNRGNSVERWYYTSYVPVTVVNNNPYPMFGPWGWYGNPYPTTTGTAFIPQNSAYVEFENGKVISWATNLQN